MRRLVIAAALVAAAGTIALVACQPFRRPLERPPFHEPAAAAAPQPQGR